MWSDKCSIELGSGQERGYAFRVQGEDFQDTDVQEVEAKGPRVMLWAAFHGVNKAEDFILKGDPESARGGKGDTSSPRIAGDLTDMLYSTSSLEHTSLSSADHFTRPSGS